MPWLKWLYEASMAFMAIAVIWSFTLSDVAWARWANLGIWAVFVTDFAVRFARASDRRQFFRQNLLDFIAILPIDFLRPLRLFRLVRLLRAAAILWRLSKDIRGIVTTNRLGYVLLVTVVLVVTGGVAIWLIEPGIDELGDGIWWSIVTTTTVGYGDISPATPIGRVIAVALMTIGIGNLGMITGTITTYFLSHVEQEHVNPHVRHIRDQLDRWDEASLQEKRQLAALLTTLAEEEMKEAEEGSRASPR